MADVNYINPTALLPKQGWEPKGFMGGQQYANQMRDYEDVMSLSKMMSELGAQAEILNQPVAAEKRLADIATARATASTIGGQKQGELDKLNLENKFTKATQPSKISSTIAENISKQGKAGMEQFDLYI